ncbi:MAG: hypothetical protein IPQ23_02660 [Cytophagaceae bacterium]|nr:hypothetical protein [Cytophagaceae bacterium]
MAKSINDSAEFTDVFNAGSKKIDEAKKADESKKITLSKNQQLAIATGAVLLGGSAFAFTTLNEDGKPVQPDTNSGSVVPSDSTSVAHPVSLQPGQAASVSGGSITPTDNIVIAHNITDSMTFEQAYAEAREEIGGGGGIFTWHGNVYNTFTKEEWQAMPLEQRQDFLADVGFKPHIEEPHQINEIHEFIHHEHNINIHQDIDKPTPPPVPVEPIIKEVTINGESVLAIDQDGDGNVDAFMKQGDDGYLTALLNSDGNSDLDTAAIIDPNTGEILESTPLDEPIEMSMDEIIAMDETQLLYDDNSDIVDIDGGNEGDGEDNDEEDDDNDDIALNDDYDNDADVSDIS